MQSFGSHEMAKAYVIPITFLLKFLAFKGQTLPEDGTDRTTVCVGKFLHGSCPAGEVIAVKDVKYGTKLTSTCSLSSTATGCCDYATTDCFNPPYTGTEQQAACSGKSLCTDVGVGEEDTRACGATYPELNHYLTMEYYCIPNSRTGSSSSATLQETGNPIYVKNTDYPNPIRASETSNSCSIETTACTSQVIVYFVHFELLDGGNCTGTQKLQIVDKGVTQTYTCSDNTYYTINQKLTSSSNYLKITLHNPDGTQSGKFWIGFKATDNTVPIQLSCPAETQTVCMDCPVLSHPANGQVSPTTAVPFGQSATYTCTMGYTLIGDSTRTCQIDGTWSGNEPTCESCPVLSSPNNGAVSVTGHAVGNTATYTCSTGYLLIGLTTRTCQADSIWSGSKPTCTARGLGDSCALSSDCSAVAYATCNNNICACVEGYIQSNNECTSTSSGGQKEGLSIGTIVGIVIGAVISIIVCCLFIFYIQKRVQSPQKDEKQSVENDAVQRESDDTSPGKNQDLLTLKRNQEQAEKPICHINVVAFDESLDKEENIIPNNELDTDFRPPQLLSRDLNDIQMPIRPCPYHMYRDDTSYASSLSFLTKNNVAPDKTSKENKIPNEAVENEGGMLELEAPKSNQLAITDAALELRRQVIPNETLIDEETWKGNETLEADKTILSDTILRTGAVVAGNKLKNKQDMIPDKPNEENKLPYEMLGNEENLTNFEVPISNQIATPERDLEHRQQVIHKETLMTKSILNRDDTTETENSQLSDEALQTQGASDDTLQNEENIISDGILKTADTIILGKTHQNEQNAIPDGLSKASRMEISEKTPRYRGIVIPILTPKTEDRLVPVIAPQRELPSKQPTSLMKNSPETEVLYTTQGQIHGKAALGETIDQGLPQVDTEFRPPRFTSCSFSDIHIPERPTPYRMYRDDSAYGSFEESLPPLETT